MINLISLRDYLNYKAADTVDVYVGVDQHPSDSNFLLCEGSQPNPIAMQLWEGSARTSDDWNVFKQQYQYDLRNSFAGARFIKSLLYLDTLGKTVNVVCTCTDSERCLRSVIADELRACAEVNLV